MDVACNLLVGEQSLGRGPGGEVVRDRTLGEDWRITGSKGDDNPQADCWSRACATSERSDLSCKGGGVEGDGGNRSGFSCDSSVADYGKRGDFSLQRTVGPEHLRTRSEAT